VTLLAGVSGLAVVLLVLVRRMTTSI
jgi:hypothetical protein